MIFANQSYQIDDFQIDLEALKQREQELEQIKKENLRKQKELEMKSKIPPIPKYNQVKTPQQQKMEQNAAKLLKKYEIEQQEKEKKSQTGGIPGLKIYQKTVHKIVEQKEVVQKNNKGYGKGKSCFLKLDQNEIIEYLNEYALVMQFFDFEKEDRIIGQTLISMKTFINDIKVVMVDENFEKFRRCTFKLVDPSDSSLAIGWVDVSISILQRLEALLKKIIAKNQDQQKEEQDQEPQQSQVAQFLNIQDEEIKNDNNIKVIQEYKENRDQGGFTQALNKQSSEPRGQDSSQRIHTKNTEEIQEETYQDDFESISNIQQSSLGTSKDKVNTKKGANKKEEHRTSIMKSNQQSNSGNKQFQPQQSIDEFYPDDFEMQSQSQIGGVNQSKNIRSKDDSNKKNKVQANNNEEESEIYTDDFESVTQSVAKQSQLQNSENKFQSSIKRDYYDKSKSNNEEPISEVPDQMDSYDQSEDNNRKDGRMKLVRKN